MVKKNTSRRKDPTAEALTKKAAELERLREFLDATASEGDQLGAAGESSAVKQRLADLASTQAQRGLQETVGEILEQEAQQVRDAMRRCTAGQYGLCEECGQPIPSERLVARPEATLCLQCQSEREGSRTMRRPGLTGAGEAHARF